MNTPHLPYLGRVVADALWVARRTPAWPALAQEPGEVNALAADTTPSPAPQAAQPGVAVLMAPPPIGTGPMPAVTDPSARPTLPTLPGAADTPRPASGAPPDTAPLEAQTPPRHPPGIEPAARANGWPSRAHVDDVTTAASQRHPERQASGDAVAPEHPFMGRSPVKPGNTEDGSAWRTDASASPGSGASPIATQQAPPQAPSRAPPQAPQPARHEAPAAPLAAWSVAPSRPPLPWAPGPGPQTHGSGGVDTHAAPATAMASGAPAASIPADTGPRVVIGTIDVTVQWLAPPASGRSTAPAGAGPRDYTAAADLGRHYLRRW